MKVKDCVEALPVSVEEELRIAATAPAVAVTQDPDLLRFGQPAIINY